MTAQVLSIKLDLHAYATSLGCDNTHDTASPKAAISEVRLSHLDC
jgi:hypothetical protein